MEACALNEFLQIIIVHIFEVSDETLTSVEEKHSDINIIHLFSKFRVLLHGWHFSKICNNSFCFEFFTDCFFHFSKYLLDLFLVTTDDAHIETQFGKLNAEFGAHTAGSSCYDHVRILFSVFFIMVRHLAQIVALVVGQCVFHVLRQFVSAIKCGKRYSSLNPFTSITSKDFIFDEV